MFSNYVWKQIIQHIQYLSKNSKGDHLIFTQPKNELHYMRIRQNNIYVAKREKPDAFVEIPQTTFETIYNELVYLKKLPNKKSPNLMQLKFSEVVLAVLAQLPNTQYDKESGTISYIRK